MLSKGLTEHNLLILAQDALKRTSSLVAAFTPKGSRLACHAGCNFCCYLMASVSALEALFIARRIQESFSPKGLNELKQKINAAYQQTRQLDNLARVRAGIACPFLQEDGRCAIYAFRPLDCVTYHSLSRQACAQVMKQPERGHPTYAARRAVGIGIKAGLGQGIVDANLEHPAFRYELIEAMRICLHDKHAMGKYLGGKNIFKSAAIMIDGETGVSCKIRYAPPQLKAQAQQLIAQERRQARRGKKAPNTRRAGRLKSE
jgi:Fe-S-cluster containining protein